MLEWNKKAKIKNGEPQDGLPRLICASGRVEEAVSAIFDDVANGNFDVEFIGLLQGIFKHNTPSHNYRGYSIVSKTGELTRTVKTYYGDRKKICFVFSGFNNYSASISSDWFALPTVQNTLKKYTKINIHFHLVSQTILGLIIFC